jgi:hypothetical protein
VANRGEKVEAGANGKTDGYDWKVTSSRLPLEIVFSSNDIVY